MDVVISLFLGLAFSAFAGLAAEKENYAAAGALSWLSIFFLVDAVMKVVGVI